MKYHGKEKNGGGDMIEEEEKVDGNCDDFVSHPFPFAVRSHLV